MFKNLALFALLAMTPVRPLFSAVVTLDFEGVANGTSAVGLYAGQGIEFNSGTIYTAPPGGALFDLFFPPRSGSGEFLSGIDPTIISFATPASSFIGYFTYSGFDPILVRIFDVRNTLLASRTSDFASNVAVVGDSGSSPNELFSFTNLLNASYAQIDAPFSFFTIDDLTVNLADRPTVIPEPSSVVIAMAAAIGVAALRRGRR